MLLKLYVSELSQFNQTSKGLENVRYEKGKERKRKENAVSHGSVISLNANSDRIDSCPPFTTMHKLPTCLARLHTQYVLHLT